MEKTVKSLSLNELKNEVNALKKEYFNLRMSLSTGQVSDTSQFRKLRVKIAQALTLLNKEERACGERV
jgi:large subunit ribosomal protein L29